MPRKRGAQPGNVNAAKNKAWSEMVVRYSKRNPEVLERLVAKLFDMALAGDLGAIKEIGDRLEGKPRQQPAEDERGGTVYIPVQVREPSLNGRGRKAAEFAEPVAPA